MVIADAHIGAAPAAVEDALLAFLDHVPSLGDTLLIDGDLFHFWFTYRRVIPRQAFRVAARVAALARSVPVRIVGGNHDRWGDDFWSGQPGVTFNRGELRFDVGGRRVRALHGDGLTPGRTPRALMQRLIAHPITSAAYRLLHPDLGMRLVEAASPILSGPADRPAARARKAAAQCESARRLLAGDRDTDLLVLGHTHTAALVEVFPGRHYLNPGAWLEGLQYAVVTATSAELRRYQAA